MQIATGTKVRLVQPGVPHWTAAVSRMELEPHSSGDVIPTEGLYLGAAEAPDLIEDGCQVGVRRGEDDEIDRRILGSPHCGQRAHDVYALLTRGSREHPSTMDIGRVAARCIPGVLVLEGTQGHGHPLVPLPSRFLRQVPRVAVRIMFGRRVTAEDLDALQGGRGHPIALTRIPHMEQPLAEEQGVNECLVTRAESGGGEEPMAREMDILIVNDHDCLKFYGHSVP